MSIIAVSRIRNEGDIIEAFTRHTAQVVDQHIFLDNGSTDETLEILSKLKQEGFNLEVNHNKDVFFSEESHYKFLYQRAYELGAKWVVPLDADEFVDTRRLSIRLEYALTILNADVVRVHVREYVATSDDNSNDILVPTRIVYAKPCTNNYKIIIRGNLINKGARILPGAHGIRFQSNRQSMVCDVFGDVVYAHFATRSVWQWISKFTVGWSKVLAAGPSVVSAGHSVHYREPFDTLASNAGSILQNSYFMQPQEPDSSMELDPIWYLGGPLKHTQPTNYEVRAIESILTHLRELSIHAGGARKKVDNSDFNIDAINEKISIMNNYDISGLINFPNIIPIVGTLDSYRSMQIG